VALGHVIGCQVAASGSGLMGLLGWCWEGSVEIVVSRGLEFVGTEGEVRFCKELCIASSSDMVIASLATLLVDCSSEDWLLRV